MKSRVELSQVRNGNVDAIAEAQKATIQSLRARGELASELAEGALDAAPGAAGTATAGDRGGVRSDGARLRDVLGLVDEVGGAAAADVVDGGLVLAAGVHLLVELEHGLLSLGSLGVEVASAAAADAEGAVGRGRAVEGDARGRTRCAGAGGELRGVVALVVACTADAAAEHEGAGLGDGGVRLGDGVVARHCCGCVCDCVGGLVVKCVKTEQCRKVC